ncbi:MAG: hypothetical protein R6V07_04405 [Armatimonadota bacterium]
MRQRFRHIARWLLTPWGATVLIMIAWFALSIPDLRHGTMGGPDMNVIVERLEEDHSAAAVLSWFTGPWVQSDDYYRPLVSVLHWADFMLWGDDGWGFGLTNALIIAATFPALTWLCAEGFGYPWAGPVAAAALTRFEPAADMIHWPAWRTDALCGLFLLLATAAALVWLREGRRRSLFVALAMLLLALLSKETALVWSAFAALMVLLMARNRRGLILLGAAFALTGAFWLMRISLLDHPLLGQVPQHVNFSTQRQLQCLLHIAFEPVYGDITATYPSFAGQSMWWAVADLWHAVARDAMFIAANALIAVASLKLLGVLWSWRIITYLPSLPFAGLWDFYYYIPTLGTALLYAVAAVVLLQLAEPRVRQWRGERSDNDDPSEEN